MQDGGGDDVSSESDDSHFTVMPRGATCIRQVCRQIRDCVVAELGYGLSESVYARAFDAAITSAGYKTQREYPVTLRFEDKALAVLYADLALLNATDRPFFVLEFKAKTALKKSDVYQVQRYADVLRVPGMLLNFEQPTASDTLKMTHVDIYAGSARTSAHLFKSSSSL